MRTMGMAAAFAVSFVMILGASVAIAKPDHDPRKAHGGEVKAFSNGFEEDTDGWCNQAGFPCTGTAASNDSGTIDRVPSDFSNYGLYAPFIDSESGKWHARVAGTPNTTPANVCVGSGTSSAPCFGPYTQWGSDGMDELFPEHGFTTSLDIYLDTSWAAGHPDVRFDWDSEMNDNTGNFLQDYVFNAGTSPSSTAAFFINSSTNAYRSGAYPENTCPDPGPSAPPNVCRMPVTISASGWYRFSHRFYDDGTGHLNVEMKIKKDSDGSSVADWTIYPRTNPNTNQPLTIAGVGGPSLGFFPNEEIYGLPVDNSNLTLGSDER